MEFEPHCDHEDCQVEGRVATRYWKMMEEDLELQTLGATPAEAIFKVITLMGTAAMNELVVDTLVEWYGEDHSN